jgi:hypothetical protein
MALGFPCGGGWATRALAFLSRRGFHGQQLEGVCEVRPLRKLDALWRDLPLLGHEHCGRPNGASGPLPDLQRKRK